MKTTAFQLDNAAQVLEETININDISRVFEVEAVGSLHVLKRMRDLVEACAAEEAFH